MSLIHTFSTKLLFGALDSHRQKPDVLPCSLYIQHFDDRLYANSGSRNRINKEEEIRDESGLGSGAAVTPNDQPTSNTRRFLPENEGEEAANADDGATGPGSDRKGDKMPGEEGVTDATDGIARFIDKLEDEDSEKESK